MTYRGGSWPEEIISCRLECVASASGRLMRESTVGYHRFVFTQLRRAVSRAARGGADLEVGGP